MAQRLVGRGFFSYLTFIRDTCVESPPIETIRVAHDFPDVLPTDFSGVLPDRSIDFSIKYESGLVDSSLSVRG
ncbi:hypothetical protein MTR67_031909 [Solanum verrucosum]|uniref:Uncharacterized protein n=1 Tax=Solanum verrucosum TaxID=315347 RepID=A0AAF0ZIB8_SOLVR|nr:hypothetical protein MTR67_031909 [Solanum verrucosum]